MRTTLTLDDDVAAALARRQRERGTKLRQEVNEVLRAGLAASEPAAAEPEDYELPSFDPGSALITDYRALRDLIDDEDDARVLRMSQ